MQGTCLKIYLTEIQKHDGKLLYEWILEQAKNIGVRKWRASHRPYT